MNIGEDKLIWELYETDVRLLRSLPCLTEKKKYASRLDIFSDYRFIPLWELIPFLI